jgi:hypothetical protein
MEGRSCVLVLASGTSHWPCTNSTASRVACIATGFASDGNCWPRAGSRAIFEDSGDLAPYDAVWLRTYAQGAPLSKRRLRGGHVRLHIHQSARVLVLNLHSPNTRPEALYCHPLLMRTECRPLIASTSKASALLLEKPCPAPSDTRGESNLRVVHLLLTGAPRPISHSSLSLTYLAVLR